MKRTLLVVALMSAGAAFAQQNTVRIGYSSVSPNSSASSIVGPLTPVDSLSLEVKKQSTLFFSYARSLTDNWDVELALGIPPTHDVAIKVTNPALPAGVQAYNGKIGAKVRQVAPTIFANYNFGSKESKFRPFLGVGINYTKFDKAESTADGNGLNGGPTNLALEDSVGLALQAGVNYRFNDKWTLTGDIATAQVKTKLTTNTLGVIRTADIKFRPTVLTVSVGYSF
jgi:outer membrane protein